MRLYVKRNKKNSMPKISKTSKTIVPKKKISTVKMKTAPVKKKVLDKKVTKKNSATKAVVKKNIPKKTIPKKLVGSGPVAPKEKNHIKSNKVAIDVISDDEIFSGEASGEIVSTFSSWPDLSKGAIKSVDDICENKSLENLEEGEGAGGAFTKNDVELGSGEEYDKQKKFFSDWATHIAPAEGADKPTLAPKKSLGLYRRQAFFYIGATLVLLLAVFYLFFARLTVLVSPQGELIKDSLSFNIAGTDASSSPVDAAATSATSSNKMINGEVRLIEVSADKTYQASGGSILGSEVVGNVTLINKSVKAQPLVVNTRLLSPDGKLFRLKEAVNIPSGGTVLAAVYADKPSADMAVDSPTRFTIPGLWAGLQDQIYAENSGALVFQTQVEKKIQQSDIDLAKKDIDTVLDAQAKNQLSASSSNIFSVFGDTGEAPIINIDSKVGDEKSTFMVSARKKIAVITFSRDKAAVLAQARLSLLVPDDKKLFNFDKSQIRYSLEGFDLDTNLATVKATFSGTMSLKSDSSLIDNKKLVGLNKKQIAQYLDSFPEIKSYELHFSPPFISTAPILPDLIKIQIQN